METAAAEQKNPEIRHKIKNPSYQETKRHSDTMFAFNIYPCTIPTDFASVPLHWQDSVEIIYVKQGTGTVQVDVQSYTAGAGDIFLVMPGHLHGLRNLQKQRMEYENIIFDMSFLGSGGVDLCSRKYLHPLLDNRIPLPIHIGPGHPLHAPAASCLDGSDFLCAQKPNGYELGVRGHMLLFFSLLLSRTQARADSAAQSGRLQKLKLALSRIERDYDKKLTVTDMAEECGYSASHFMRWFRESTGSGFSGYLIDYRLGKAARALQDGTDSILQIAEQNGFENLSNFNRLFKKRFDMTPGQFRRQSIKQPGGSFSDPPGILQETS